MILKTLKKYNNMKKTYISPLAMEVSVISEPILTGSLKMDDEKTVDTTTGQLSGGRRGEWGNLWE